jgi:DNA-binding beta-propeller fold protein YncE
MMRSVRLSIAVLALTAASLLLSGPVQTQEVQPVNGLPNPYETIRNWGVLPDGRTWGSTAGVDIDPDGKTIWALDRCGSNSCAGSNVSVVNRFDPSGKFIRGFGGGMFIFPHGMHVDREGNVWVTDGRAATPEELKKFPDAKGKGHTVVKFSPEGKVLLTLGKPGVAGTEPGLLDEPNDVVVAANGDIFVGDGHSGQNLKAPPGTNARIVKFDRTGKFIKSWGKLGSAPGEFRTPHALVIDQRNRLIVADRGNVRLQLFDLEGKFLEEWKQFSRVSGMYIRDDVLYAIDSESSAANHPGWRKGLRIGSARDGKVMFFIPPHMTDTAEGAMGEGVAVDANGDVYGAEVTVRGLTKFIKRLKT